MENTKKQLVQSKDLQELQERVRKITTKKEMDEFLKEMREEIEKEESENNT